MTETPSLPLVYVPALHPTLLPVSLPGVLTLSPGLPGTGTGSTLAGIDLPFSPEQCRLLLADMLEEAERAGQPYEETKLRPDEEAALARLGGTSPDARREALEAAHKTLLLAWNLEERLMEIQELRDKVGNAWDTLQSTLGKEAADSPSALPGLDPQRLLASLGEPTPFPWKAVLAAVSAFTSPETAMVTADAEIRHELTERGMLHPMPGDMAEQLQWPAEIIGQTLWARLPLSRLLLAAPAGPARPWLDETRDILVLPAATGVL